MVSDHLRKYFTPLPSSFLGDVTNVLSYDPSLEIMLLCQLLPLLLLLPPLLVTQGAPTPLTASLLWASTLDLHDSYKEMGTLLLSLWCEALDVPTQSCWHPYFYSLSVVLHVFMKAGGQLNGFDKKVGRNLLY